MTSIQIHEVIGVGSILIQIIPSQPQRRHALKTNHPSMILFQMSSWLQLFLRKRGKAASVLLVMIR